MGEHLPCKQGVKSSNLSVSIEYKAISSTQTAYLENFIQRMILRKDFQRNQTSEKQTDSKESTNTSVKTRKTPVTNAIDDRKQGQAKKSAGWMPWH